MKPAIGLLMSILVSFSLTAQRAGDFSVTHYTSENGLPQNSIKGIEMDKDGFLWVGTEAGLARFDGQQFRLYDQDHHPVLSSNRITMLWLDTSKRLCFGDGFRACYSFDHQRRIKKASWELLEKRAGVWDAYHFSTLGTSVVFRLGRKPIWQVSIDYEYMEPSYGHMNNKFYYWDKHGRIWSLDTQKQRKKVQVKGLFPQLGSLQSVSKLPHGFYTQDTVLYLFLGKGVYRLRESGNDILEASLVLETDIADIYFYRNYPEQNLQVIGTPINGIYLYRRKQFSTHKHNNGYGNFYPQVPYGDSGVLTNRGLVYPSSSLYNYPIDNGTENFRALLRDSHGHYWINKGGIYGKGYKISETDQNMKVIREVSSTYAANCIRETPDGHIWMSDFNGAHLGYVEQDTVRWLAANWTSVQTKSIVTFLPINKETFWVAGNHTLAKLNIKTGQQIHYIGLEKFLIETLYLDNQHVLWMGTEGSGFFALKQDSIYRLPLDKNAGLKNVHAFLEDKNGFIWMSTNNGLFRCQKKELDHFIAGKTRDVYYQCFKKESGFNTNEFNGSCTPSGIVLGNGKFSLPSLDGLVQFYPDSIYSVESGHTLLIDNLSVDGKEILPQISLKLPPSFNHMEIEIAAPYFGDPANQLIEYNVQGLDQQWYPVRADNKVTLNRLPYGNYSLQFRAQSGFGNEGKISMTLPFIVIPFFYQTWYFKLITIIVVLSCIFFAVRLRYAYLLKRNKKLEEEVSERTLGLREANKLKEKMLMMVGHDLQSPLYFLDYLSQAIYDTLQRNDKVKAGEISLAIKNTSSKIYTFVEEFHLWARIQDEKYNLRKEIFAIQPLMTELADFSRELLRQHNNTLQLEIEQDYKIYTNRDLLKAILRNLIDNANKHTRNGGITIVCIIEKGMGKIAVADNGKGIAPNELDKIRKLVTDTTGQAVPDPNGRLGFQFIIEFATRLDIKLNIDSEQGKGTLVSMTGLAMQTIDEQVPQPLLKPIS